MQRVPARSRALERGQNYGYLQLPATAATSRSERNQLINHPKQMNSTIRSGRTIVLFQHTIGRIPNAPYLDWRIMIDEMACSSAGLMGRGA
jgi:hypothetical protein